MSVARHWRIVRLARLVLRITVDSRRRRAPSPARRCGRILSHGALRLPNLPAKARLHEGPGVGYIYIYKITDESQAESARKRGGRHPVISEWAGGGRACGDHPHSDRMSAWMGAYQIPPPAQSAPQPVQCPTAFWIAVPLVLLEKTAAKPWVELS